MRLLVGAAGAVLVVVHGPAAGADPSRFNLRVEAGAEYDTNAGRVEQVEGAANPEPIVASPLGRLVVSGDLWAPLGSRQSLALSASAAGKGFVRAEASREDVAVAQAAGNWSLRLGQATAVGLGAGYYDVFQHVTTAARDFRSLTPAVRIEQGLAGGVLTAGAGHRWFTYKPEGSFSFAGPSGFLLYRRALLSDPMAGGADWEWNTGATAEWRRYQGGRCVDGQDCPPAPEAGAPRRVDRFATAHLEITRTGDFLLGGGIAAHINDSNSYGESLVRGLVHVRGSALLPGQIALTGRAEILFTRYGESVPLARDKAGTPLASIEDENRSTIRLELVRPLGEMLDLGARYTFYTNDLRAGPVQFRRQTFLLFAAIAYGTER